MKYIQKEGDDSGMQTRVWGPAGWLFLHSIAQNYPWNPSSSQKREYLTFFSVIGSVLPCRYCRDSYKEFIKSPGLILSANVMTNRKTLVTWLYNIHNRINKKLGYKDIPKLNEVWDKYESFRSKCTKTIEPAVKGCVDPMKGARKRCFLNIVPVDKDGNTFGSNSFGKKLIKKSLRKKIRLISVKKSTKAGKKLMATFENNGRKRVIHFGAAGMSDYTRHKDPNRKKRYFTRHSKDLSTRNPMRAGYLSMFILWNKKGLSSSIADYRRRLNTYNRTGKFPIK